MLAVDIPIPFVLLPSPPNLELVTIKAMYDIPIIFCLVYLSSHPSSALVLNLINYLNLLFMLPPKTILLGDSKFPDINWDTPSGCLPHANLFCDLIFTFNLSQRVTSPTHICGNFLALCNDPDFINDLSMNRFQENHLLSDHHKITFTTLNFT